jgi:hypothetical protein
MTSNRNDRILGGILGFFKIMYGLLWVLSAFIILIGILMPWNPEVKEELSSMPINFTMNDALGSFMIDGTMYSIALIRTSGMIRIKDGPLFLSYINLFVFLLLTGVILYGLRLAIRIVERVRAGKVFLMENVLDLRRIAAASIFIFLFFILARIGFGLFASGRIVSSSLIHTGLLGSSLDFSLGELILPLFLWALAEVFRAGVAMKEEHDLTI